MNETLSWYDQLLRFAPLFQVMAFLFVGSMAALVAWQQVKTAKRKLKLDLFDKRYEMLKRIESIGDEVEYTTQSPAERLEVTRKLISWARDARWLFDDRIELYTLRKMMVMIGRMPSAGEDRQQFNNEWGNAYVKLRHLLAPYLEVKH